MSWRQYVKALEAENNRKRRETVRAARDLVREQRQQEKRDRAREVAVQKLLAANEAEQFSTYLERLVGLHKDCEPNCDWKEILAAAAPASPIRAFERANAARKALADYRPSIVDAMFGKARRQRDVLERAIREAEAEDARAHEAALASHAADVAAINAEKSLAARVLRRDASSYALALETAGALTELKDFGTTLVVSSAEADAVAVSGAMDDDVVPREETKLTAGGKLSTKELPNGRYWTLFQDHLASAALRLAGEVLAVFPISRVVVNLGGRHLNTQTGHLESVTLLAVHVTRDGLSRINLSQVDPSDSMRNFPHRMKFKSTTGLSPVEPMTLDEQWIST
jgi:hypothetical protein